MIRNIIFDLGNVLISFRPAEYLKKNGYPEDMCRLILSDIFQSSEWLRIDNGDITVEEGIKLISLRSCLKREEIAHIFKKRTEVMFPLRDSVRILPELKEQGLRLYYLSNFPGDIFNEIRNKYAFFQYFNGGIISAEVRYSKPDLEIFRIFLEKYSLNPKESLYVDDIEVNVKSAEQLGMKVFFTGGSEGFSNELLKLINSFR